MKSLVEFRTFCSTSPSVHCVGLGGAGMRALAEVLLDAGCHVTGTDSAFTAQDMEGWRRLNVDCQTGQTANSIPAAAQLVIASAAVPDASPELVAARERGLHILSYPQALAWLTANHRVVAVAGTHGKSSTTSLVGQLLAKRSPTIICGAASVTDGRSGRGGESDIAVVEACEYRRHFLNIRPTVLCLLGIEPDHFDCYPRFDDAITAYRELVESVPAEGSVVYNRDCSTTTQLVKSARCRTISFARHAAADTCISVQHVNQRGTTFSIRLNGRSETITLPLFGNHQAANATAALLTAVESGTDWDEVVATLSQVTGLQRRFETRESGGGQIVIDDYAHHPTEIRATIETVRWVYPGRRLITIFQPHQVSRTRCLFDEFAAALALSDEVWILPVYGAREVETDEIVNASLELTGKVQSLGTPVRFLPSLDQVWPTVDTCARSQSVVVTMGAGNIQTLYEIPESGRFSSEPV